ncbi:MAG TPA: hypothetical protein VK659_23115 [Asanoa sp.]|nr:hypothetical protein [Asanoa sp.]
MFGHAVKMVSHATLGALAATLAIGLAVAPNAAAVEAQSLVGAWSGPASIGDAGECGPATGEFAFSPNGGYRYQAFFLDCGIVMIDGRYELPGDGGALQLSIDACGQPRCPPVPSPLIQSISFVDPDTIVLDGRYTYQRQHG